MRVKFNGKELDTDFKTSLEFFENISKNENDVWIINGFATKENIALNENDELFCTWNSLKEWLKDNIDLFEEFEEKMS